MKEIGNSKVAFADITVLGTPVSDYTTVDKDQRNGNSLGGNFPVVRKGENALLDNLHIVERIPPKRDAAPVA